MRPDRFSARKPLGKWNRWQFNATKFITHLSNENDIAFENIEETIGDEIFEISLDSIRRLQHHAGAVVAGAANAGPAVNVGDVGEVLMRRAGARCRVGVGAANAAGVDSLVAGAAP